MEERPHLSNKKSCSVDLGGFQDWDGLSLQQLIQAALVFHQLPLGRIQQSVCGSEGQQCFSRFLHLRLGVFGVSKLMLTRLKSLNFPVQGCVHHHFFPISKIVMFFPQMFHQEK